MTCVGHRRESQEVVVHPNIAQTLISSAKSPTKEDLAQQLFPSAGSMQMYEECKSIKRLQTFRFQLPPTFWCIISYFLIVVFFIWCHCCPHGGLWSCSFLQPDCAICHNEDPSLLCFSFFLFFLIHHLHRCVISDSKVV